MKMEGNIVLGNEEDATLEEIEDELVGAQVMPSYIHKQAQVAVKTLRNIFNGKKAFPNPKDHEVLMRLIRYVTKPEDLILDSFAGSGATGHAVLQLNKYGGARRFILVEMNSDVCRDITVQRLNKVIHGYRKSGGGLIEGTDGGFRFCVFFGEPCFDETGRINPRITYDELARHVYFTETGEPIPEDLGDRSPLIGIQGNRAIYLFYNGVLKDKKPNGGNVLTQKVLANLSPHDGPRVVYGTACRLSSPRLKKENVVFRQIPYQIRVK